MLLLLMPYVILSAFSIFPYPHILPQDQKVVVTMSLSVEDFRNLQWFTWYDRSLADSLDMMIRLLSKAVKDFETAYMFACEA